MLNSSKILGVCSHFTIMRLCWQVWMLHLKCGSRFFFQLNSWFDWNLNPTRATDEVWSYVVKYDMWCGFLGLEYNHSAFWKIHSKSRITFFSPTERRRQGPRAAEPHWLEPVHPRAQRPDLRAETRGETCFESHHFSFLCICSRFRPDFDSSAD